jgi:hypothetical protein
VKDLYKFTRVVLLENGGWRFKNYGMLDFDKTFLFCDNLNDIMIRKSRLTIDNFPKMSLILQRPYMKYGRIKQ